MTSLWLAVAGVALADSDADEAEQTAAVSARLPAAPKPAPADPDAESDLQVIDVDIATLEPRLVCHREKPTGSRISVERCYPADAEPSEATAADRLTLLQEFERLRRQQEYQRQAQLAEAQAMLERMRQLSGR